MSTPIPITPHGVILKRSRAIIAQLRKQKQALEKQVEEIGTVVRLLEAHPRSMIIADVMAKHLKEHSDA